MALEKRGYYMIPHNQINYPLFLAIWVASIIIVFFVIHIFGAHKQKS
jgi:uncharacterized protein YktB (UPF0637 family)